MLKSLLYIASFEISMVFNRKGLVVLGKTDSYVVKIAHVDSMWPMCITEAHILLPLHST